MKAAFDNEWVYLRPDTDPYISTLDTNKIKKLPMVRFDRKKKMWKCPVCLEVMDSIEKIITETPKLRDLHDNLLRRQLSINRARLDPEPAGDYPVKADLYEYQLRAANMAMAAFGVTAPHTLAHSGFGLLFEMGCGKTLTSIAVIGELFRKKRIRRVLIVAPASVVAVWPKEFARFALFPVQTEVMVGTAAKKVEALRRLAKIEDGSLLAAVINYESVWRHDEDSDKSIIGAICDFAPDMIICDESQRIKSPAAQQSKALHKLGGMARYKLILSGTPQANSPMDFWSQYRFLDTTVFGDNYYSFRDKFAVLGGFGGKKVVGIRNTNDLMRRIHSIALRVTKEEALDLPEQVFTERLCEMLPREKRIYRQVASDCFAELEEYNGEITAAMITTRLLRLQQITGGFCQLDGEAAPRAIGSGKLAALKELIEDLVIDGGKKLVIFARFRPELEAIRRLLNKLKLGFVSVDGSVPVNERGELVDRFQREPDCLVFAAQVDSAGLGITLTAADTAVYYSCSFNYATYEQSLSRIHRIGQANRCTYIRLVCPDTIDERIYQALEDKKNLAELVVDGWRDVFI